MRAGVGHSENIKSVDAATEAARAALAQAGLAACDVALVFTTSRHDPTQIRDGLRAVLGPDCRIVGGYAFGVITGDFLGYDGYEVGVAAISADRGEDIDLFLSTGLPDNEAKVGAELGRQIRSKAYRGEESLVLLYDSIKGHSAEGLSMNMATPLLAGMNETIGDWPTTVGIGMFGDMGGNPTHQWFDDDVQQGTAMGVMVSGGPRLDSIILHGCRPASGYHTITKTDGPTVLELDGRPAVEVVTELLGPDFSGTWEDFPLFITLGVNHGDKYGPVEEDNYQNRLAMAVDKERGGLVMLETDLVAGAEVQLMRRSIDFRYMHERIGQLMDQVGDREPVFALYIDCAGRVSAICASDGEEAVEVQRALGGRVPLLGVYQAVEIAQVRGSVQPLDWTGVLCIFSQ